MDLRERERRRSVELSTHFCGDSGGERKENVKYGKCWHLHVDMSPIPEQGGGVV